MYRQHIDFLCLHNENDLASVKKHSDSYWLTGVIIIMCVMFYKDAVSASNILPR